MIKVLINGCNGKMGKWVQEVIKETDGIEVVAGFDKVDTGDNDFPVFTKIDEINIVPDVIIDFSVPLATLNILGFAVEHKIPIVIATTGFSSEEQEKIYEARKVIPVFKSSNMSYEINLMSKIIAEVAKKLPESDIEIVETHHRRKVDAPSGTALLLADSINSAMDQKFDYEYNRHTRRESRPNNEIGIHSIRGGTEAGNHSVIFFGNDESLKIEHNVTSRKVFAVGSIKAAKFIINKEPGLYDMNDIC
jgi:4-hydroxy-tetrahydrodipicolinate reductase